MTPEAMKTCPYCGAKAECVNGSAIYAHRPDLSRQYFWKCSPCAAWVGCHPGTKNPLGRLANAALRKAKSAAHRAFDPLWMRGSMRRGEAYRWLSRELQLDINDCHIGMFDEALCARVVAVCNAYIRGGSTGRPAFEIRPFDLRQPGARQF